MASQPPGRDPRRRNRNAGTAKHSHGRDNLHVVPQPRSHGDRSFYRILTNPVRLTRTIAGREILFSVEPPIRGFFHHCTVEDITRLLTAVPADDWDGIQRIVLQQPTRRQNLLRPVWGRLVFGADGLGTAGSAIHIDAQNPAEKTRWTTSLDPDSRREMRALAADGHHVVRDRRHYDVRPNADAVRVTQLYRTLLHEIGHFVDRRRWPTAERHFQRSWREREAYAARYAHTAGTELRRNGMIPFDRIRDEDAMRADGIDPRWFWRTTRTT